MLFVAPASERRGRRAGSEGSQSTLMQEGSNSRSRIWGSFAVWAAQDDGNIAPRDGGSGQYSTQDAGRMPRDSSSPCPASTSSALTVMHASDEKPASPRRLARPAVRRARQPLLHPKRSSTDALPAITGSSTSRKTLTAGPASPWSCSDRSSFPGLMAFPCSA